MGLPTSYLTSTKNLEAFFRAIQAGQAPDRFTLRFLESLEFKSSSDRLLIPLLKSLRFIDDNGVPTQRYFDYLDQTQGAVVLAEAIQDAYSDIFRINRKAYQMSKPDVQNKFKTLTQGKPSDAVLDKMAMTFLKLCSLADFENAGRGAAEPEKAQEGTKHKAVEAEDVGKAERPLKEAERDMKATSRVRLDHLAYNIQIVLPESRDPAVFDAIFRSLKEHLLG